MTQRSGVQKKKKKKAQRASADVPKAGTRSLDSVSEANATWRGRVALALVLVVAFVLRSIWLDLKPVHFDEGINGNFVAHIWREGFYRYDPTNFHGPLYFYVLLIAEAFLGRSIVTFRFVTGLISLGNVWLVASHRRFLGRGALWAAAVMAVSTGTVFYSRYAIHESLFIFGQLLFSYGFFLWQEERSRRAGALIAASIVCQMATKETFFIFLGVWMIAVVIVRLMTGWKPKALIAGEDVTDVGFWRAQLTPNDVWLTVSLSFAALVVLFTGCFLNPAGFHDMFAAFMFWTKTGVGNSGHEKPFTYWLDLFWRYEWPCGLALIASIPIYFVTHPRQKILALVAFGTWLAYSLIPYKTPWLILGLIWPLSFVFGFTVEASARIPSWTGRWLARLVLALIFVTPLATMERLNFQDFANEKEPYVYVQSTNEMKRVVDLVQKHVRAFPEDLNIKLLVLVRDPWPLPWIFSEYPNLSYGKPEDANFKDAGLILIDGSAQDVTEARLTGHYWRLPFQIRDSYEKGFAYLDFERFKDVVPSDSPTFEKAPAPKEAP